MSDGMNRARRCEGPRSRRRPPASMRGGLRGWTALALAAVLAPSALLAHAVVYPSRSQPGAYETYVLRVPNERPVPTRRVELTFPAEVTVVSFADVPGWSLEVVREGGRVTRAAWTGTIGVERFVDLPFIAVNPEGEGRIVWNAVQTYEGGERVAWTGPEGSEEPASVTEIREEEAEGAGGLALGLAAAALALSLISVGLVLRRSREAEPRTSR